MILLSKYDAFRWQEKLSTYVKGYFHDRDLTHEDLLEKMLKFKSLDEFTGLFQGVNGEFSATRETEDFIFACSDYTRSFPIFYAQVPGDFIVSDSPDAIRRVLPKTSIDETAMWELRIGGTTFGERTLYNEIKSLGSGEALFFDKKTNELKVVEYLDFDSCEESDQTEDELLEELKEVYERAIENALGHLQDETLVVPLANGWWERVLMKKIKELGLRKVILYSHGSLTNPGIDQARKIAEYYGYPWYMVEYKPIEWFKWYIGTDYREFLSYSTRYNSVPNIGQYLAIKALTEKKVIPKDAIFINVSFVGFMMGDVLPRIFLYPDKITDEVLHTEVFRLIGSNVRWKRRDYQNKDKYIEDIFKFHPAGQSDKSWLWKLNYAYWKERVGKYTTNTRRIYEMYGYRWINIQMERSITDFWSKVPAAMRYQGILQHRYDALYNKEILAYLDCKPYPLRYDMTLDFKDRLRLSFPDKCRKLEFKRQSNALRDQYDSHPLLWYNIVSRRDFDRMRPEIANMLGLLSIKYIWDFLKENNFEIGG